MKKKILITGAAGQLGTALKSLEAKYDAFEFTALNKDQLDITNAAAVESVLNTGYDYVINTAAYTAVDKAEDEKERCFEINVKAIDNLIKAFPDNSVLIHISSDYVYHHNPGRGLLESDLTLPKGVYAQSKLEGEQLLIKSDLRHIIIRTSWVYDESGHNFVNTMLRIGAQNESISVVNDQIGSPTYAKDLGEAILEIIKQIEHEKQQIPFEGVFNYSNEGDCSWADFASLIFELENINCKITGIKSDEYSSKADRPKWSVLDKSKIRKRFGLKIPDWQSSLKRCLENRKTP